jgi:multiple antibiotic resistance protein
MALLSLLEASFLAAFTSLFAVSNPIGCALIYGRMTANLAQRDRSALARRVAINAGTVLIAAMWAGGLVLAFFGITLASLRVAGGLVIAAQAWRMLENETKDKLATNKLGVFYPLTIPFTTGPGTIAVAINLGSARPASDLAAAAFALGSTLVFRH